MHGIHHIILQVQTGFGSGFIIKTGIFVFLLTIFIIFQAVFSRMKKNRIVLEKSLLKENFDRQLLINKVEVQEATMNEIGKELHDNVNQLLSTAKMFVGLTERKLQEPPDTLLSANEALDKAILELRNVSKSLNKEWVDKFDLKENLVTLINSVSGGDKIHFVLNYTDTIWLTPPQQFILFRLMQEAINNILRHAEAFEVMIYVNASRKAARVLIADNGKGYDATIPTNGLGMPNMIQRARAIGGQLSWETSPQGTKVILDIANKNG
jgi:signal transduction histidine kinase